MLQFLEDIESFIIGCCLAVALVLASPIALLRFIARKCGAKEPNPPSRPYKEYG